jgi:chloride channel protein, CIC family
MSPSTVPKRATSGRPALRELRRVLARTAEPLELELLGRILLHSVLVGAAAGLVGSLFYYLLELTERLILEGLAGYEALRAGGEEIHSPLERAPFRPSLLWVLPAVGALLGGLLSSFAPETRGGGADAIIKDFHRNRGAGVRRLGRARGTDDADRRRARFAGRTCAAGG